MSIMGTRLIITLVLALGLYFIFNLSRSTYELWQRAERVKDADQKRILEEKRNHNLKKKLDFVQSPFYIEQEARNKLGLSKPGETMVIIPPSEATQSVVFEALPNWKRWWRLFF